jgi:predicted O-methyltransferase YrrM
LGLALGCGLCLVARSGEAEKARPTDEVRNQFIKDFKHIGLDSTAGDGLFLRILVEASRARRGVEVGTCRAFGAINMGIGFERTGGRLDTVEIDANMVKAARENIAKVGLEKVVTVHEGDALKVLPTLEGPVDFVFIDALKSDYFKYFKILEPKLKVGAIVAADNAIKSAKAMQDFLDFMATSPDWEMVVIRASMDKNDGMAVCYKVK